MNTPVYTDNSVFDLNVAGKTTSGLCTSFDYLVNSMRRYVIYCPREKGRISTLSSLQISFANTPYINGDHLPVLTAFAWSDSIKGLRSFKMDPVNVIPNRGLLKIQSVTLVRIGYVQEYIQWVFKTENPIPSGASVFVNF